MLFRNTGKMSYRVLDDLKSPVFCTDLINTFQQFITFKFLSCDGSAPSQYFMTSIKLTFPDVTMVKNNSCKSCPMVSLITGGYYSLFVDIVTYLPRDPSDF